MRKSVSTVCAFAVCMLILAVSMGCEENNLPDAKKSRLIAVENMQLKEQIKQRDAEIEKQKQLLAECEAEKNKLHQLKQEHVGQLMGTALAGFSEENQQLKRENESLKAQVEALKKELGRN